jgi:hypothetical protein
MKRVLCLALVVVLALSLMAVPVLAADAAAISVEASKAELAAGDTVTYTVAITGGTGLTGISFGLSLSGLEVTGSSIKCIGAGLFQQTVSDKDGNTGDALVALVKNDDGTYSFFATGTESTDGVTKDAWTILTLTCKATEAVADTKAALTLENELLYKTVVTTTTAGLKTATEASMDAAVTYGVQSRVPGDGTGDGEVDIRDVVLLRRYLAGASVSINLSNADVTGDGEVDIRDLVLLRRYLAGADVELS